MTNLGSAAFDMPSSDTALAQHQSQSLRGLPPHDQRRKGTFHQHSQSLRDFSCHRRASEVSADSSASTATTISSSSCQGSSQDVLEQMRLEVEKLKRRQGWVQRQQERLSPRKVHENVTENFDPRQVAPMQTDDTRSRGPAEPPSAKRVSQSAKPLSLKKQLRVQSQALLEWQPANYPTPLEPDLVFKA